MMNPPMPALSPRSTRIRVERLTACAADVGEGVGVGVAVADGVALGVGVGLAVAAGLGVGVGSELPEQTPGPALSLMKPETVPLNGEDAIVPEVVFPDVITTTTKLWFAGTVNE